MLSPNDFSFKIFHKLRVEAGDRNIFISPASIFAALSILHNGASGETAAKMSEVMAHAGVKSGDLNRLYEDLLKTVKGQSAVKLHLANSLWMRQGVMFLKDFVETALKVFEAETGEITTAKAMNDWISKKTEGKIADVVKEVPVDAILFITNAIYFKGKADQRKGLQPGRRRKTEGDVHAPVRKIQVLQRRRRPDRQASIRRQIARDVYLPS
ncbi:MAG: hypothetical protein FJ088_08660 [Deltaproteobacteria bacterium]|nr:hypothetical protein [Deltaproteobacteria bacterium]